MFKKTLLAAVLASTSFSSLANWTGGVSYIKMSDEINHSDLTFGVVAGSLAYEYKKSDKFSLVPELRVGTGIKDDTIDWIVDIDIDVKRFISLSVRGQYDFNNKWYGFAAPSYSNVDVEASRNGYSVSEDEWEFGYNAGFGINVSETTAIEVMFEDFDGTKLVGAGLKFAF